MNHRRLGLRLRTATLRIDGWNTVSWVMGVMLASAAMVSLPACGDDSEGGESSSTGQGSSEGGTEAATEGGSSGGGGETDSAGSGSGSGEGSNSASGSGGATSDTATGGLPEACAPLADDDACDTCVKENCCEQAEACLQDPECDCFQTCVQENGNDLATVNMCAMQCGEELGTTIDPFGEGPVGDIVTCTSQSCALECVRS